MNIFDNMFGTKRDWHIPASILLGSLIIAISIIFGARKITDGVFWGGVSRTGDVKNGEQVGTKVAVEKRADAPKMGNGKVVVEIFSDFQCPFCQKFVNEAYAQIKSKYIETNKITFVFRHFPLNSIHKNAQKAGEGAECANRQGKFSVYHDTLFAKMKPDGTGLNISDLKRYALDLGLDTAKFNKCLDGGEATGAVNQDLEAGRKAGVSGTPTIFINGEGLVGAQPFAIFEEAINRNLK